jgi:hypothetical protein
VTPALRTVGLIAVMVLSVHGSGIDGIPKDGVIPNAETATKVGEAVLIPVFGQAHVDREKPLRADPENDYWIVYGTLKPNTRGGTVMVKLKRRTGEVVRIWHSQ